MDPKDISIDDFDYDLDNSRIAKFPLEKRDQSKLLVFDGEIKESTFQSISNEIPDGSLIVRNNTRVVRARLEFRKPSGARIEIFCLEPINSDPGEGLQQVGQSEWNCLVGNAKKWKSGPIFNPSIPELELSAELLGSSAGFYQVRFNWKTDQSFAEILELFGQTPLPPYLQREATQLDKIRYQTVYAKQDGSVAAPTAGLHFTDEVEKSLIDRNCQFAELTLHVSAGTFLPVKSETIGDHEMHVEHFEVSIRFLKQLKKAIELNRKVIVVGTTSLRALESLSWLASCEEVPDLLGQWEAYELKPLTPKASIDRLIQMLDQSGNEKFVARTGIMIAPGYRFQFAHGLITNFHQPKSTLLLLIAAIVGNKWKDIYNYALRNEFRFLSYGDSSILWRK